MSKKPAKHPIQNIYLGEDGIARFVENKIVSRLVGCYPGGLNELFTASDAGGEGREDYEQLMMLIGYSVSGFGDLSTSDPDRVSAADNTADELRRLLEESVNAKPA